MERMSRVTSAATRFMERKPPSDPGAKRRRVRRKFPQRFWLAACSLPGFIGWTAGVAAADAQFLSDLPELIISARQDWGVLGFEVAAHQPSQTGLPLRIGTKEYAKGLGHHANGEIVVLLDGAYAWFDAEIGVQPLADPAGSVIFRVLADGRKRFESGAVRSAEEAKAVHVSVEGAQELRLEASDAGDGINCDMANWANARLTPSESASGRQPVAAVDVAPFARVVTWDANRMDGCRASRIEEFRAEDVFLETDVPPNRDGNYTVPAATNGLACIGLQWLNRRALKELSLQFADRALLPPARAVQVQGWFGESAWQGHWKPLPGTLEANGERLTLRLAAAPEGGGLLQVQKVRWVFPAADKSILLRGLSAFTRSRWDNAELFVQAERPAKGARGQIRIYNGEFRASSEPGQRGAADAVRPSVGKDGRNLSGQTQAWDLLRPLHLGVRYSRPASFKSDATVLQFRLPSGAFGVAVEDVLSNECVYLPDFGLYVAREPIQCSLADYKKKIAGRKTVLQQVREMPDQTLAQAMSKTHHEAQSEGPVMLSLACDNNKFVVDRDGTVHFQRSPSAGGDWFATAGLMRPRFGTGGNEGLTRRLEGGWLPVPIITVEKEGVVYAQRTFVAPVDAGGSDPARLNRKSVCVAEFSLKNKRQGAAQATLSLEFLSEARRKQTAQIAKEARGFLVSSRGKILAVVDTGASAPLQPRVSGGSFTVEGDLPAGAMARCAVYWPGAHVVPEEWTAHPDADKLRADAETYWNAALAGAMRVETPEPLLNNVIRSSQVRCLIAARPEADGARVAPWIAAMSYGPLESEAHSVIRGMDFMGHAEFARRGLDFFIHRYNTNGFLTTGYTTFGTAWHLWTLGEHYQLDHDEDWLQGVAPEVARVGQWILRQTEKTKQFDAAGRKAPEFGLLPPGVLADWNAFAYHFCLNAYYDAALREVGIALNDLRRRGQSPRPGPQSQKSKLTNPRFQTIEGGRALGPAPEAELAARAAELKENIRRAYHWTQAQAPALPLRNGTWVPAYPSQVHSPGKLGDFFPGQDAGRSWCYDVELGAHQMVAAGVLDANSPEVARMMEQMEDGQFLADGWFDYPAEMNRRDWFNLGGFSKVQPYYTRNGEIYAMRDEVKPFIRSYFNTMAAMLNPEVLTFWEHFHHSGAWDKTHETGYFLQQTRFLFVMERGDDLWLAPFVTSHWMQDGNTLAVSNVPTRFGKVSYRITSRVESGFIEAAIQAPTRAKTKAFVIRFRHPEEKRMRSFRVQGARQAELDRARECIRLRPDASGVTVRAQYE